MASVQTLLDLLSQPHNLSVLTQLKRGIEKEGLRCDSQGFIAQTDHPSGLGSALTHGSITTDYSEALLEFITPVLGSPTEALSYLDIAHRHCYQQLSGELIWPSSMPCEIDGDESIRIAEYGDSNLGHLKHVYRRGLWHRYGRVMQSIAGIHYNFSLPDSLFEILAAAESKPCDQTYRTEKYLDLIRNFRRYSWLLIYLFGASPAASRSFVEGLPQAAIELEEIGEDTLCLPYATSLRMSDLGYQNHAQASLSVCYNSLERYIETLTSALSQPYSAYQEIPVLDARGKYQQLNTNLLQIENEYYSDIRPKRVTESGEMPLQALSKRGIEYIEVRCTDVNPYLPLGMDSVQLSFMDVFLTWCALHPSPAMDDDECQRSQNNLASTVTHGRQPGLLLDVDSGQRSLQEWAMSLLDDMTPLASLMDTAHGQAVYASSVNRQRTKVMDSSLTPSAQILHDLQRSKLSFNEFTLQQARQHRKQLSTPLAGHVAEHWQRQAQQSKQDQWQLENASSEDFSVYLANYLKR